MKDGPLKTRLAACTGPFHKTDFSIAHRGAPLQFPEHSREVLLAAARMGAGVIECDVAFTKDRQLVCRHSQCDLHTTTNILSVPALAAKCTQPFSPADPATGRKAAAKCCTSDITLAEFKTLTAKMDGANADAGNVADYQNGTPRWRTDLYANSGTLMTHAENIALIKGLGTKFTPELKAPRSRCRSTAITARRNIPPRCLPSTRPPASRRPMCWRKASVSRTSCCGTGPSRNSLRRRCFSTADTKPRLRSTRSETWKPSMAELKAAGVKILAPPIYVLLALDATGQIVASEYAKAAKAASLDLITWSLERDGPLNKGGGFFHRSVKKAIDRDGDTLTVLDVLAQQVGVRGVFSDWPATTTFYASCMGMK